jgi:hypothetical protein
VSESGRPPRRGVVVYAIVSQFSNRREQRGAPSSVLRPMHRAFLVGVLSSLAVSPLAAQEIVAKTAGMDHRPGLITLHVDRREGQLLLELPGDSLRLLHFASQATGLGSNPIGIDRGASGSENVARFERIGQRVLVTFENWNYRGQSGNVDNERAVREGFATSVVASLPVVAAEGGRVLVNATEFFQRDWTDVAGTLAQSNQGNYTLARDRTVFYDAYTKSFPNNTEVDVQATFVTTGRPGPIVSQLLPDARAITLRVHHTFVALPDQPAPYRPRMADPRVNFGSLTFKDFGQPLQGSLDQRWIGRHRLERTNPRDPNSPFVQPIVYYIDRGIPEPVRRATVEGAKFWEEAFAKAGLAGGFVVRDLPEGADPLDIRYNVVQWINRNERGWSVGGSLADPRTGQILKGMARMDSHRARTDYNLFAGLLGADPTPADTAFMLARVRQVTAHEIGHTLGMAHNYIASTYERGSVMEYPPPRVRVAGNGRIDVSDAYAKGPGVFDVWAIRYGYGLYPADAEADSLAAIVKEGVAKGWLFLADEDARPDYASDPRVQLWDDETRADGYFTTMSSVRRVAMQQFGERNIRPGEPLSSLQERFVPVYLMHRFAAQRLAKTIGGMEYHYAMRGDGQTATRPVDAARQRDALTMLTDALSPAALAIPDTVLRLLAPRAFGYRGSVELFQSRTRPMFDELGAAQTLAQYLVDLVLQRERAARVVQQSVHAAGGLTLPGIIERLLTATTTGGGMSDRDAALQRVAHRAVVDRLLQLAADAQAAPEVRGVAEVALDRLRADASARGGALRGSDLARAHWTLIGRDIDRWRTRGELPQFSKALPAPPGDPIGEDDDFAWPASLAPRKSPTP